MKNKTKKKIACEIIKTFLYNRNCVYIATFTRRKKITSRIYTTVIIYKHHQ